MDLNSAIWRKSSYSSGQGGECVEVADLPTAQGIRDSKHPGLASLLFTSGEWSAFTTAARADEL